MLSLKLAEKRFKSRLFTQGGGAQNLDEQKNFNKSKQFLLSHLRMHLSFFIFLDENVVRNAECERKEKQNMEKVNEKKKEIENGKKIKW